MQLSPSKGNIIEKILRDKERRLVRAKFYVYENAGRIKARLVSVVYVDEKVISEKTLSLSFIMSKTVFDIIKTVYNKTVKSPYFNKESIYFSGSKPRAPTFA